VVNNRVQFAVVREDPAIEVSLLSAGPANARVLLVGSGGCTALTLAQCAPLASITLLEPNENQIRLIQEKTRALRELRGADREAAFSIGSEDPKSLTSCGNFESLFRSLRRFIHEFVAQREDWDLFFAGRAEPNFLDDVFGAKYWPIAFDLFFSESVLVAMFTAEAIQHAPRNSYPPYFREVLERGLRREDSATNYFLHHIFLGSYINQPGCLPEYLTNEVTHANFRFEKAFAQDVSSYANFDLMSFSNIFDWMSDADVKAVAKRLQTEAPSGSWMVYRQLNNEKDYRPYFGSAFVFDEALAERLHGQDRSLFYSKIAIARKV
jgi:S-adenosylmethionine-diacylglycerol 3-amino-3-carboxypropyl transferase